MPSPSGEQFEIIDGNTSAIITEVGATLRVFAVNGRQIVWSFGEDEMSSAGRGQVLAPWPNRLADGHYAFGGRSAKAALDEPERHNAIHGFVRWLRFDVCRQSAAEVTCTCLVSPQPAYPWWLRLEIVYTVAPGCLSVRTTASNPGDEVAPFALGFHPYFASPTETVDDLELFVPAARHLELDERGIPTGSVPLDESPLAGVRDGLSLAGRELDDDIFGLDVDPDGRWRARIESARMPATVVWADAVFGHVMVFTADTLDPPNRRRALALEPMTAPPNALASGVGVIVLEPGAEVSASWGIEIEMPSARARNSSQLST